MATAETSRAIGITHQEAASLDFGLGLSSRQVAAIKEAEALSQQLINDGRASEIVDMFRQSVKPGEPLLRYLDIAQVVMPEEVVARPGIAKQAVYQIISALVIVDERDEITRIRRVLVALRNQERMGPEALKRNQRAGGKAFADKVRDGTVVKDAKEIVEGRGMTRWIEDEIEMLNVLAQSPKFQHHMKHAVKNGTPDWKKIADFINRVIHKGKSVRSTESVSSSYKSHKPK